MWRKEEAAAQPTAVCRHPSRGAGVELLRQFAASRTMVGEEDRSVLHRVPSPPWAEMP